MKILKVVVIIWVLLSSNLALCGRFASDYPCSDIGKTCVSSGEKVIDGEKVHRDCWQWSYTKTCNYPSKNNCGEFAGCYFLGERPCALFDSLGNCVNIRKEFSCERFVPEVIKSEKVRYGAKERAGENALVCEAIPCIDGNCIDKSYEMDKRYCFLNFPTKSIITG